MYDPYYYYMTIGNKGHPRTKSENRADAEKGEGGDE